MRRAALALLVLLAGCKDPLVGRYVAQLEVATAGEYLIAAYRMKPMRGGVEQIVQDVNIVAVGGSTPYRVVSKLYMGADGKLYASTEDPHQYREVGAYTPKTGLAVGTPLEFVMTGGYRFFDNPCVADVCAANLEVSLPSDLTLRDPKFVPVPAR